MSAQGFSYNTKQLKKSAFFVTPSFSQPRQYSSYPINSQIYLHQPHFLSHRQAVTPTGKSKRPRQHSTTRIYASLQRSKHIHTSDGPERSTINDIFDTPRSTTGLTPPPLRLSIRILLTFLALHQASLLIQLISLLGPLPVCYRPSPSPSPSSVSCCKFQTTQ